MCQWARFSALELRCVDCSQGSDVVFVLDLSGSIGQENVEEMIR